MSTFVLVGGAWIGGWVWKQVAEELRGQGHVVYPATLTGLGERVHLARPETNLDTHIADVANLIEFEDLHDVVLAGHSYAGIVITGVADRMPERLSRLVFVDSAPFQHGMSMLDLEGPQEREQLRAVVADKGEGWRFPFPSIEELGQSASLDGLTEEHIALMRAKAVAQPFGTYEQPLHLTRDEWGDFERVIIACNDFRRLLALDLPMLASLKGPDWRIEELPTGHWPMLSAPKELAEVLGR